MKIDDYKRQENYYKKQTEKARLEMIEAISKKDKVLEELKEQRRWLNEIKKQF